MRKGIKRESTMEEKNTPTDMNKDSEEGIKDGRCMKDGKKEGRSIYAVRYDMVTLYRGRMEWFS
jgi:hypothetical protein